jgi:16S rRNA (uracil1498-N3)-methyltransferase
MRRFLIRAAAVGAGRVRFARPEAHHMGRVLRLRPGALVEAADERGRVFTVRLEALGPDEAHGSILAEQALRRESPCAITLAQAVLKGDRMTWLVQKATELGVARIVPLLSARVVARTAGDRAARWSRVASEAVKQCRRAVTPTLDPPRSFEEALSEVTRHEVAWLLWEGGGISVSLAAREAGRPRRVLLLVGPEGGFTSAEVAGAEGHGARLIGLGPRTLRAESAALAGVTLCQHLFGDLE